MRNIAPEHYTKDITSRLTDIKAVTSPDERSVFIQVLESVYRFSLGSMAGGEYFLAENGGVNNIINTNWHCYCRLIE